MRIAQVVPMSVPLNGLWLIWAAAEMNKDFEEENYYALCPAHLYGLFLNQADKVMRIAQIVPMSVPFNGRWLIWDAAEMNKDVEEENYYA